MELERSENILIVTHQAILRCIYAYFMKTDAEKSPWMNVPLHTLIKLTPRAYSTEVERFESKIQAVSTWRGKGSVAKHEDPVHDTVVVGLVDGSKIVEKDEAKIAEELEAHSVKFDEEQSVDQIAAKVGAVSLDGDGKNGINVKVSPETETSVSH